MGLLFFVQKRCFKSAGGFGCDILLLFLFWPTQPHGEDAARRLFQESSVRTRRGWSLYA